MDRKKVTIRGVEPDLWREVVQLRDEEQVLIGGIVNEALRAYLGADPVMEEEEFIKG